MLNTGVDLPVIYVPAYAHRTPIKQDVRLEGCMVLIGHDEVYDGRGSWRELKRILSGLPAEAVLLSLAKINAVLHAKGVATDVQRGLAHELMSGPERERALELLQEPDRGVFFEEQLLALMKQAILCGKRIRDLELSQSWDDVVRAALLASQLIGQEHQATGNDERDLTLMVLRSLYFNSFEAPANLLARYYDLWVLRPRKKTHQASPNYVDIEALFREATGLDICDHLAAGFALAAHFMRFQSAEGFRKHPFQVSWNDLKVSLSEPGAAERFVQQIARPMGELAREFRLMPAKPRMAGASLLPFFTTPVLLMTTGELCVLSVRLLLERLTAGVYWVLHDHMKSCYGDDGLYRFTRFVGELFQDQIFDALSSSYPDSPGLAKRLYGEMEYGRDKVRGADATLIYSDAVVFFEVGTSRLRYDQTILQGDLEAFDADIDKCIVDKAGQLDRVISDFRRGKLVLQGTPRSRIGQLFPVLVLLDPFPEFPLIWRRVHHRLVQRGWLQTVECLHVLSAEELEMIEPLLGKGETIKSLLASKADDPVFGELSMKSFILARFPDVTFRGGRLEQLYTQFRSMMRERLRVEEDGPT